jgi:redox-sensitive bicupin YhaK (pirin superfamily)
MKKTIHRAPDRGHVNFGWLDSFHSFSFGHWNNPEKIHFGALRVLNDDVVSGGGGFGKHPHDNMEIVSIPLSGALAHSDSTGNSGTIQPGDIQIMSAGSGIQHAEYNASKTDAVNFLQIWVFPKERNIKPRYDQKNFNLAARKNSWQTVVSNSNPDAVWINQDASFSFTDLDAGKEISYAPAAGHGIYLFVIDGNIETAGEILNKRDAIGVEETDRLNIKAVNPSTILAIEVPMEF